MFQDEYIISEKELMAMIGSQLTEQQEHGYETGADTFEASCTTTTSANLHIHSESDSRPRSDSFASTITTESLGAEEETVIQENLLFDRDTAQVLEGDMHVYADSRPLAEAVLISCAGTFTVYLNADGKIEKYVFLYSAMETSPSER